MKDINERIAELKEWANNNSSFPTAKLASHVSNLALGIISELQKENDKLLNKLYFAKSDLSNIRFALSNKVYSRLEKLESADFIAKHAIQILKREAEEIIIEASHYIPLASPPKKLIEKKDE